MWIWDYYTSDITAILVFLLTLCLVYLNTRRPALAPPGPNLWPIIGNLPCLIKDPVDAIENLREKYGDIVGVYIGSQLNVFVSRHEAMHDVLVKRGTLFSWRPETAFTRQVIMHKSIAFANGEKWKTNRHFTQTTFQKLCFNNDCMFIEERITEELSYFIDKLAKVNKPTDISTDINLSVANVMFSILHGYRSGYTDSNLLWYLDTLQREFKTFRNTQLVADCFPFLLSIPWDILRTSTHYKKIDKCLKTHFNDYCLSDYDKYIKGQEKCLVHHLITALKIEDKNAWEAELSKDNVWVMLHDLMAAGSETTATTIKWILLYMIREPEVQRRAREDIERVIGKSDLPSLKHRKHLPFVDAIILEGLRLGQVVPFGLPHSVAQDTYIHGYHIPKNTTILLNQASVSKDPNVFSEPNMFKPERFLSDDRKRIVVPKEFIPFSRGPRSCLGESLARIELFMYITTLLQKFEIVSSDINIIPGVTGELGVTYAPKPYNIKILPR